MAARRVFIIVRAPNGDVREVPLGPSAVVIGRDESADIRVEDRKVSRRHVAFKLIDGEPWVEDLGSANGIKLNGRRVDKRARLNLDDKVRVGGYQVTLRDLSDSPEIPSAALSSRGSKPISREDITPNRMSAVGLTQLKPRRVAAPPDDGRAPVLQALDSPVPGKRFVLRSGENIIGRLEECDLAILDGSISRQHARVVLTRDGVSVTDLGSSNGTFVNDVRVETAELTHGDVVRIGNIRFRVELPPELAKRSGQSKARSRTKRARSRPWRWAPAGAFVLLLAIAVLSATVYWRFKRQGESQDPEPQIALQVLRDDAASMPSAVREGERTGAEGARDAGAVLVGVVPGAAPGVTPAAAEDAASPGVSPALPADGAAPPVTAALAEVATRDAGGAEPAPSGVPDLGALAVRQVVSSTSPYSAKDDSGLPIHLPAVDEAFDFERFVAEKTAVAQAMEKDGEYARLRVVLTELLDRDPINKEARLMLGRVVLHETAEQGWKEAEKLLADGKLLRALKLYATIPEGAPESPKARAKIEELKARAIQEELLLADKDLETKATWSRAHRRFQKILEIDPAFTRALNGIRTVERKMRGKSIRYTPYAPPSQKESSTQSTPEDINDAIAKHYGGDDDLARVARLYAQGSLPKAIKRAESLEKHAEGDRKATAKRIRQSLKSIQSADERVRNEISNDPHQAWAKLVELERFEADILPAAVKSTLREELEESVAEAFADRGESLFDRSRFADAFQHWDAGYKLDPLNQKILAGLKKLEEHASKIAEEAEIAAQRGERNVCDRWKTITRMTRSDSDVHKRALERAKLACGSGG